MNGADAIYSILNTSIHENLEAFMLEDARKCWGFKFRSSGKNGFTRRSAYLKLSPRTGWPRAIQSGAQFCFANGNAKSE
jgi:hypothetical protein